MAPPRLYQLASPVLPPPRHLDPDPGGVLRDDPGDAGSIDVIRGRNPMEHEIIMEVAVVARHTSKSSYPQ